MDQTKSCLSCPSFLMAESSVAKFKKSIGSPICGRYGIPLGRPGAKEDQVKALGVLFANKCDSHGEELPPIPREERLLVALPDPKARVIEEEAIDELPECRSCAMCVNFIRDDIVQAELGWTTGLCAAKGKLILPNRQTQEARNCEYKKFGPCRSTTQELALLPEYEEGFQLNTDPVKAYFKAANEGVTDPSEYPSDKEVSDQDFELGVRAWRKVKDPYGSGREVFLPIYRRDFFLVEDQGKIPNSGDDEHPELYVDHFGGLYSIGVQWTEMDETPMLWGEAGVGKTELFRHVAWLMQMPFERFSITARTELDDLAGKMHYDPDKGTYFQYGRLVEAWRKPCVIVLDEPNTGPPEVWQFLRPLTDNSKQLVLDQNNGECISRHTDAYLGMAANPAWDPKNVGAAEIGDADASRLMHLYVPLPPEILEREIIRNRVKLDGWELDDDQIKMIMTIASEIRGLVKDDTLPITWGIRPQLKVARALKWFDPVTAYRRAVADFLEPEAQEVLLAAVRANVS